MVDLRVFWQLALEISVLYCHSTLHCLRQINIFFLLSPLGSIRTGDGAIN